MPRQKIASKEIDLENGTVSFKFADADETVLTVSVADLPQDVVKQSTLHGVSQKVGDGYSGADDPEEAITAAKDVIEQLKQGNWSVRRAGGGGARVTKLAEALARATGQDRTVCQEKIAAMTDDEKKKLRKHPQIAKASAEIDAERAQKRAEEASKATEGADAPDLASVMES